MLSRSGKALAVAATIIFLFILHQCFQPDFPYSQFGMDDHMEETHSAGIKQPEIVVGPVWPPSSESDSNHEKGHKSFTTTTLTTLVSTIITSAKVTEPTPNPLPIPQVPQTPQLPQPPKVVQKLPAGFPKKVWQSGPKPISQETRDRMETWVTHNPSFRHEFLSDDEGDAYVKDKFSHRPDIVDLYLSLTVKILKADLLRYLILLADGGIWSDIDVSCLGPVDDWIPAEYGDKVSIVVGQEFDFPWRGEGSKLSCQFTNWVFMAKPGTKHFQMVVDDVVNELREIARNKNVTLSELKKSDLSDVVDVTGPKKMTVSLLKSLSLELGAPVDDRNVSTLKRPVLVGDLLVHPGAAFAASQAGYPTDQGPNFVTHHYAGSWKGDTT